MANRNSSLNNFYTISDNTDVGAVTAVTAVVASVTLAGGLYKIAAMGTPLLWKLGSTNVTAATGSYLAAGDQEVIYVAADNTKLSFIRSADATADGQINYVPVAILEFPNGDLRNLI